MVLSSTSELRFCVARDHGRALSMSGHSPSDRFAALRDMDAFGERTLAKPCPDMHGFTAQTIDS